MRMSTFSRPQIPQAHNPAPFALPARHPLTDLAALSLAGAWYAAGWPGPVVLVLVAAAALVGWRRRWPGSFDRFITGPTRSKWRRWHYQRHWAAVMTIGRLAPAYQGRLLLPVLGQVPSTRYVDRVLVGIVSGQSAEGFARRAPRLAHGFAALTRPVRPG